MALHGFLITYAGLNALCEGRAVVIAETQEQAEKLVAEHPDSSEAFPTETYPTEVDITRPGVIYNDPGL
jgi:hypothetical protein